MKKIILYIGLVLVLFSCEKTLELDADARTSKLVVNTLFSSDKEWRLELTRSLSVLDDGNLANFIDNATVNILDENNDLVDQLSYNFGYYVSLTNLKPIAGNKYKVEVSAPNYESVSSEDFCPSSVAISNLDTTSFKNSFGDKEYITTIRFQDPSNTENYYGIEVEASSWTSTYYPSLGIYDTTYNGTEKMYLVSSDPSISESGSEDYQQTLVFKDNLFDGLEKSVTVNYNIYDSGDPDQFYVMRMRLISFTESSYNYSKSIEAYQRVEGNPFAEPVQVYSNIEGGFGIFGGQSNSEIEY